MTWNYEVTHNEDGTFSIALPDGEELRIVPSKREWVGLTDVEVKECCEAWYWKCAEYTSFEDFLRSVETKLKEKNT